MSGSALPSWAQIRYLSGDAVDRLLPSASECLALVDEAFSILRHGAAQVPATRELAPRDGAFAHAMPSYLAGRDITAVKWIAGFPKNREAGLPYLSGLIVVNDSDTGLPLGVMDCAAITAARTASVSAYCVTRFAPREWKTLAVVGYGVQARAHIQLFREVFGDRIAFCVVSRMPRDDDGLIRFVSDVRQAAADADVIVTGIPLEVRLEPPISASWLSDPVLVLPLDDDASLDSSVANRAIRFYVDDLDDFELRRDEGRFRDWRDPDTSTARAAADDAGPSGGITVCANQGMGLLDAVFAHAVLSAAEHNGVGTLLDR